MRSRFHSIFIRALNGIKSIPIDAYLANDQFYATCLNRDSKIRKYPHHACSGNMQNCDFVVHYCSGNHDSHSVASPSMVDPQWNIWYWGSKWNLHTVCRGAVGCEWGTTSVYFGITYVCLIPSRFPVFAVEPQYRHQDFFIFVKSIIWRTPSKISCWFKF